MFKNRSARAVAILEALLASIIWASSFVFVKLLLPKMGPLTIAGLRYFLGFLILLPLMLRKKRSREGFSAKAWLHLTLIGLSAYTLGNGAMFWALKYLTATTISFLMGITPLLILFGGVVFLKEIPTQLQVVGLVVTLIGNALFFSGGLQPGEPLGLTIAGVGIVAFSIFGVLGRGMAREAGTSTLLLTGIPLGIGGGILLLLAIPLEGWPVFDQQAVLIILWLAVVNTAAAYLLYNHSLKTITALEMNVFLNLSPFGTAALAWLLLGERVTIMQIGAVAVAMIGVTLVQARRARLPVQETVLNPNSKG